MEPGYNSMKSVSVKLHESVMDRVWEKIRGAMMKMIVYGFHRFQEFDEFG